MFKRFTDCDKWEDPWFRRLPVEYKLLWSYICDHCDNAGVWKVDMETAAHFIGQTMPEQVALEQLSGRIMLLGNGYWLVTKFVEFQFGSLSSDSPLHKAVLKLIDKHTLSLPYPYPSPRVQVKVKDKVKDKRRRRRDVSPAFDFNAIWIEYPRKLGREDAIRSFADQVKTDKDWQDINTALNNFRFYLKNEGTEEKFIPHGSTWFNKKWRDWITYTGELHAQENRAVRGGVSPQAPAGKYAALTENGDDTKRD